MSAFMDLPLMEGSRETLLRPGPKFRRLEPRERSRLAGIFLDLFDRLQKAHNAEPRFNAPVPEMVAWAVAGEDIGRGVSVWRRELFDAQKAARRAVAMGHGCPALDPAGGPGHAVAPLHPEPATPCKPLPGSEIAL